MGPGAKKMIEPFSRSVGSQSEVPIIEYVDNTLQVSGYHGYKVKNGTISVSKEESELKFRLIRSYLDALPKGSKIIDIGCSAGAIGLQLVVSGHKNITFLDHDPEYTQLVSEVLEFLGCEGENKVVTSPLGAYREQHDVGIALALIHWLYSYTERYGSLFDVIEKLKHHAKKTLIVEWVAKNDPAIKSASHIFQNPDAHKAPYNYEEFKSALRKHYSYVERVGSVHSTREIWIASVDPIERDKQTASSDMGRIREIRFRILYKAVRKSVARRTRRLRRLFGSIGGSR